MKTEVLVAGVGNIFLGDDGFGCAVAQLVAQESLPVGVIAKDYGISGLHLAYEIADGVRVLILVDALPDAGGPGEVVVFEADLDRLDAGPIDAHGMDPATVLTSVRNLGVDPPRTLVVGCQPSSLEDGIGLSPVVEASVEPAKRAVLDLIEHELMIKEHR